VAERGIVRCPWPARAPQDSFLARARFTPTGFQFATSPPQQALNPARAPTSASLATSPRRAAARCRSRKMLERRWIERAAMMRSRFRTSVVTGGVANVRGSTTGIPPPAPALGRARTVRRGVQALVAGVALCIRPASNFAAGVSRRDRRGAAQLQTPRLHRTMFTCRQTKLRSAPTSIERTEVATYVVRVRFSLLCDR
jgi:hypothetical protein